MKDLKDLKVGDKAFIPVTITSVDSSITYPIKVEMNNGYDLSFTLEGNYSIHDKTPSLFLTNPFEQQGKDMLVRSNNYDWNVRDVIVASNGIYVKSEWLEAKEIPEPTELILSMQEIADKFGVDVETLKIKK